MSNIYLSKSKYCRATQCNKILWLDKYKFGEKIQTARDSVLENGNRVGELAKSLFGKYEDIKYCKDLDTMLNQTSELLKHKPNVIAEASFKFDNNFCSVDILKNDIDGVEIYEVKSSVDVHDIYIEDVSYQYYVLTNLGINVKKVCIVYLNRNYVRKGNLELDKLFNIDDVTNIAKEKQKEINLKIAEVNEYMQKYQQDNEPEETIGMHCFEPYDCEYWEYCSRHLPENNIFKIKIMHWDKKFEYYYQGKESFEDMQNEDINPKYLEQIDFEINNREPKIEVDNIRNFLDTLSYPIYFLDFETFQQAIPEYDGINPYMQIPFQYSLHYIEKQGGELKHKEFLAQDGIDPRRELAERLVEDIPRDVCVTAYNMGFEKGVIKRLAETFPDLSEHLLSIRENIKDLMTPFLKRYYYVKEMHGSYSIKSVLPALYPNEPDLDYHNLPVVHNGDEASNIFADLVNRTEEEKAFIRNGLLEYCKLDTYAMVKVWERLKEAVGE